MQYNSLEAENLLNFLLQKGFKSKVRIKLYKKLQAEFPLLFLYSDRTRFRCLG